MTKTARWSTHFLALGIALAVGTPAMAQAPATPVPAAQAPAAQPAAKPGVVEVEVTKVKATVEAVDQAKRTVTLKGQGGRTVTLKVDKSAKNFDQVKVGDTLAAEYVEATAVYVRKAGGPPVAASAAAVELAPKGKKPAGVVVDTTELTATVENINYERRLVTLRGPAGNAVTLKVGPRVENLKQVKIGDELVIRHTEALAIAVGKPGA